MKTHIITYATHSEGKFEELINNQLGIKIKVLGWGEKWNGLMSKILKMYEYIQTLPEDDMIIFVDGFDVVITKPINIILQRFNKLNTDILVSKGVDFFGLEFTIFGTCNSNYYANSGMYMGCNKHIKPVLKYMIDYDNLNNINEDQLCFNKACPHFNIKVDVDKTVFHNVEYIDRILVNNIDSCFISTPGEITWTRLKRVPSEYGIHILKIVFTIIIILTIIYLIYQLFNRVITSN